ncbi:MAG: ankyrin repeat domain-containing protein [Chitinophagaceae bacterium]|nr:MAG: ankyrin repeat domain-containing protein [Chitinophagaceae bacterium]
MKYIFSIILSGMILLAQAQQSNKLLDGAFWKTNPAADAIKAEVANGANPAELNGNSFDPVVMAINAGVANDGILYLLEQKGNDVNKMTHDSRTYLHWSASKGNVAIIKYLLDKGARTDVTDSHGMTPLNFAVGAGQPNLEVYDLLIGKGAKVKTDLNSDGANALLLGIGNDPDFKLTEYFISKGLDLKSKDATGNTAFDYAARSGNIKVMNLLLSKGVKPTQNAMIMASQGTRRGANGIAVFKYLDSLGVKPTATSATGENVLHSTVRRPGQAELVKYFLSESVNANQADNEGNTPFMYAAASGKDTVVLNLLLTKVKNINQVNKKGMSALAMAMRSNTVPMIEYLLSKGADLQVTDAEGNNVVYYVMQSYSPRSAEEFDAKIKLLAGKGIDFTAPQKDGSTLYHLAVAKNDLVLLKKIEPLHADVNAKNKEGLTPLHKAAMIAKDDSILKYLLSIGARRELTTSFSETAFDLSQENEYLHTRNISTDFLK